MERDPVIVVTGGARGVGRAIVERLLDDGASVVVIDRDASDGLDDVRSLSVCGDAGSDEVAERAVAAAADLGDLTGWVNNAAVFRDAWLHEAGGEAVAELIAANLRPALAGSAAALRAFRAGGGGGAIVNVSSHQAQRPVGGALPYATAKAAIEGLTRALAVDYGPWNVRVNAVALGSIVTERMPAEARVDAAMAELHPLGRAGAAAEAADAVAYLLSRRASFISGAVVPVDGGRSVHGPDPEAHRLEW